jgi:hypothetical protein
MSELEQNGNVAAATTPRQVQLTVSGVQNDLNNGLSRLMIQAKYNLSGKDLKALFSNPKLKGLKTKTAPGFVLIDDTEKVQGEPQTTGQATDVQETAEMQESENIGEVEVIEEVEVVEEEMPWEEAPSREPWEEDLSVTDSIL